MKKEEVIAELTLRGIEHDPEAGAPELKALLKQAELEELAKKAKKDVLAKLNELGIDHDASASLEDLSTLLPDAPKAPKAPKASFEPVLVLSKGKFSLFQTEEGWEIKNDLGQLISSEKGKSLDGGHKMLMDLNRGQ